jgi:glyoxylase-like metal-dependent hydrolase (beta-lactamase superfamily II)
MMIEMAIRSASDTPKRKEEWKSVTEKSNPTKYRIQGFNAGTFWVPRPEVYWMQGWGEREEMNLIIFLVRGGGKNILINTGPPRDLSIMNKAWLDFFGFDEAQIVRAEEQRPEQILKSKGLRPEDIDLVIVTPLQAYATANIHLFRNAQICISRKGGSRIFKLPIITCTFPDTCAFLQK